MASLSLYNADSTLGEPFSSFHSFVSPFLSATLNLNAFLQPSGPSQHYKFGQFYTNLRMFFSAADFNNSSNSGI